MNTSVIKTLLLLSAVLLTVSGYSQPGNKSFNKIYALVEQKSFIKARELYEKEQQRISTAGRYYITACLDNSFNKLDASEAVITHLQNQKNDLPDSLWVKLLDIRKDNAVKSYRYKDAKEAVNTLLNKYQQSLSTEKYKDLQNDLKLWEALENVPPQTVNIKDNTVLSIIQDKAGLKNLSVAAGSDSLDFVFDTGANISTVARSVAQKMNMTMIPANIQVGAITGKEVAAQLAVCGKLMLGNIEMKNVVFLVFEDADLSFPSINYHINGILGFPVIEAMKEIRITKDNHFEVFTKNTTGAVVSPMALSGLIPVIFIEDNPYTFDTGADHTMLFKPYFIANKDMVMTKYQPTTISFGGAGGVRKVNGYNINFSFNISGKNLTLDNISLASEEFRNEQGIYGNIGQDLISKFNAMILNFEKMLISFE